MNKKLLIGAGVLVLGYLAYKHFKKTDDVSKAPTMSNADGKRGTACRCANGVSGFCKSGDCGACCAGSGGQEKQVRRN